MLVPIPGSDGSYNYDPSIPAPSGGGGGGSSDYTIAHVTLTNNSSHHFAIAGATLYEGTMYPTIDSDDMVGDVLDIVLYKGVAILAVVDTEESFSFTVTGDIVAGRTTLTVSGDGTVVIADGGGIS